MFERPRMSFRHPNCTLVIGSSAVALAIVLLLWFLIAPAANITQTASPSTWKHGTYATDFPLTEDPISEGGKWISGKAVGVKWSDVRTAPGLAFGTETGSTGYDDSTALLTGNWGPDQAVQATVHSTNQTDAVYEEVELRLRSALSAHSSTGYEINFRCLKTSDAYMEIVRWNGRLGKFTRLLHQVGAHYGVADGDVVKATVMGNVITAYKNGIQMGQVTDSTYTTGSPGIGFYLERGFGMNSDYGFTTLVATDEPKADIEAFFPTSLSAKVRELQGVSSSSDSIKYGAWERNLITRWLPR